MKKIFYLLLFLFMLASLFSCQKSPRNVDLNSISKYTWKLAYTEDSKVDNDLYPEGLPFIKFTEDGNFKGSTGCNSYNSNIVIEGSDFETSGGSLTQKGCSSKEKEAMEKKILQGIFQSGKLVREGNILYFMKDDKVLLRYKK